MRVEAVGAVALLALGLVLSSGAAAATALRLEATAGGFDLLVDTDVPLDVVTAGIRTADGCAGCAFVWDDQRLIDRGLQGPEFLEPGPNGKVGLEKVGSFVAAPAQDHGVDFITIQGMTLLGGAFGSREAPLNEAGETTFRLGTLLTGSTAELVSMEELVPVVGDLLVSTFPSVPDRDGDGVGNAADNCLEIFNAEQEDRGGVGLGSGPDGVGDVCQCGDVTGDGLITMADSLAISRSLLEPPTAVLRHPERCDVGGDEGCSTADALIIRRALLAPPRASVAQQCEPGLADLP